MEPAAFRGERRRHRGEGAAGRPVGRVGGHCVHGTLQVLQVVQPPERILGGSKGVDFPVDADSTDVTNQLEDVAQFLRGNSGLVKAHGRVERPGVPDGVDEAARADPRAPRETAGRREESGYPIERRRDACAPAQQAGQIDAGEVVVGAADRALSPFGQPAPHASHRPGRPPMGLRLLGEQCQHDVRLADRSETAPQASDVGAQDVRIALGWTSHERQGFAQPTRCDPSLVHPLRLAGERARGVSHHGVGQRADHLRQVAWRRRGSMAHLRRPASITSL